MSRLSGVPIRFGCMVRLKSGGADMLVVDVIDRHGNVSCDWIGDRGEVHTTTIPTACLNIVRYPKKREPWRTG